MRYKCTQTFWSSEHGRTIASGEWETFSAKSAKTHRDYLKSAEVQESDSLAQAEAAFEKARLHLERKRSEQAEAKDARENGPKPPAPKKPEEAPAVDLSELTGEELVELMKTAKAADDIALLQALALALSETRYKEPLRAGIDILGAEQPASRASVPMLSTAVLKAAEALE